MPHLARSAVLLAAPLLAGCRAGVVAADDDPTEEVIFLPRGESTTRTLTVDIPPGGMMDIALVVDTTCSMALAHGVVRPSAIVDGVAGVSDDVQIGYASWDDYQYSNYGRPPDLPFEYEHGISSDVAAVDRAVANDQLHEGYDSLDAGIEALYQAAVGAGYDQDCDGVFEDYTDVPPFIAREGDAFGGAVAGVYDPSVPGIGTGGGMGFRTWAQPVFVLIAGAALRDPDEGHDTPGGCPRDAGSSDVIEALASMDAWMVGIAADSASAVPQLEAIAEAIGSTWDGQPSVAQTWRPRKELELLIIEQIVGLTGEHDISGHLSAVTAAPTHDPLALVRDIHPARHTDVHPDEVSTVSFEITLAAPPSLVGRARTRVTVEAEGDGTVLARETWIVELGP